MEIPKLIKILNSFKEIVNEFNKSNSFYKSSFAILAESTEAIFYKELQKKLSEDPFYTHFLNHFIHINCMFLLKDLPILFDSLYKLDRFDSEEDFYHYCGIYQENKDLTRVNIVVKDYLYKSLLPRLKSNSPYKVYYYHTVFKLFQNNQDAIEVDTIKYQANIILLKYFLKDYYYAFHDAYKLDFHYKKELFPIQHAGDDYFDYRYYYGTSSKLFEQLTERMSNVVDTFKQCITL